MDEDSYNVYMTNDSCTDYKKNIYMLKRKKANSRKMGKDHEQASYRRGNTCEMKRDITSHSLD